MAQHPSEALTAAQALVDQSLERTDWSPWAREQLDAAAAALSTVLAAISPDCQRCGVTIDLAATGRPRAFCSAACRQAAYRERAATERSTAQV